VLAVERSDGAGERVTVPLVVWTANLPRDHEQVLWFFSVVQTPSQAVSMSVGGWEHAVIQPGEPIRIVVGQFEFVAAVASRDEALSFVATSTAALAWEPPPLDTRPSVLLEGPEIDPWSVQPGSRYEWTFAGEVVSVDDVDEILGPFELPYTKKVTLRSTTEEARLYYFVPQGWSLPLVIGEIIEATVVWFPHANDLSHAGVIKSQEGQLIALLGDWGVGPGVPTDFVTISYPRLFSQALNDCGLDQYPILRVEIEGETLELEPMRTGQLNGGGASFSVYHPGSKTEYGFCTDPRVDYTYLVVQNR
jgi:hypothetical protein